MEHVVIDVLSIDTYKSVHSIQMNKFVHLPQVTRLSTLAQAKAIRFLLPR